MKKSWILASAGVIALGAVIGGFVYTARHPVAIRISGIQYHDGSDHQTQPVAVTLNGDWYRTLSGQRIFRGTVDITGASRRNRENHRPLTVGFQPDGMGPLVWGYFENGQPQTYSYGSLFVSPNFRQVAVLEGGWSPSRGLALAGPATTRSAALKISNHVMRKFLRGSVLN